MERRLACLTVLVDQSKLHQIGAELREVSHFLSSGVLLPSPDDITNLVMRIPQ